MTFVGRVFLVALLLGVIEVYLLFKVAAAMSFLGAAGLCALTAIVGSALVRQQGLQTLRDAQTAMVRGQAPTSEIVSGLVLLVTGVLLIVPGFISDSVGFLALIPPLRRRGASWIARRFEGPISTGFVAPGPGPQHGRPPPSTKGRIIDIDPED